MVLIAAILVCLANRLRAAPKAKPAWLLIEVEDNDMREGSGGGNAQDYQGGVITKEQESKKPKTWPDARVPYEFAPTLNEEEKNVMKLVFGNFSDKTNLEFVPRTEADSDYLLISNQASQRYGDCASSHIGYHKGEGAHGIYMGGCKVNPNSATHELIHILGFTHVQNRPDRCNYIDVDPSRMTGWGEFGLAGISDAADWFSLRIPYDCSSGLHGNGIDHVLKPEFMQKFKKASADCGEVEWDCINPHVEKHGLFKFVDSNGQCKENGFGAKVKEVWQLKEWEIWALNAAYKGKQPECESKDKAGDGKCDKGNNHIGCEYDGGDCCLPDAKDSDCIDPCGVRWKFFGGKNRKCMDAPMTKDFCFNRFRDPSNCEGTPALKEAQCSDDLARMSCIKTCGLCNTELDSEKMDKICNDFLGPELVKKYSEAFGSKKSGSGDSNNSGKEDEDSDDTEDGEDGDSDKTKKDNEGDSDNSKSENKDDSDNVQTSGHDDSDNKKVDSDDTEKEKASDSENTKDEEEKNSIDNEDGEDGDIENTKKDNDGDSDNAKSEDEDDSDNTNGQDVSDNKKEDSEDTNNEKVSDSESIKEGEEKSSDDKEDGEDGYADDKRKDDDGDSDDANSEDTKDSENTKIDRHDDSDNKKEDSDDTKADKDSDSQGEKDKEEKNSDDKEDGEDGKSDNTEKDDDGDSGHAKEEENNDSDNEKTDGNDESVKIKEKDENSDE